MANINIDTQVLKERADHLKDMGNRLQALLQEIDEEVQHVIPAFPSEADKIMIERYEEARTLGVSMQDVLVTMAQVYESYNVNDCMKFTDIII